MKILYLAVSTQNFVEEMGGADPRLATDHKSAEVAKAS
jgi:hypothetical protein